MTEYCEIYVKPEHKCILHTFDLCPTFRGEKTFHFHHTNVFIHLMWEGGGACCVTPALSGQTKMCVFFSSRHQTRTSQHQRASQRNPQTMLKTRSRRLHRLIFISDRLCLICSLPDPESTEKFRPLEKAGGGVGVGGGGHNLKKKH